MNRCTLLDTARKSGAPITLGVSTLGPNSIDTVSQKSILGNTEIYPVTYYANSNIIVQQNTPYRNMAMVGHDSQNTALAYSEQPWIGDNIYYAKAGAVFFYDGRPYDLTHPAPGDRDDAAAYAGGLTSEWKDWAMPKGADLSRELDPKIDGNGRSTRSECFGMGVQ